jgi:hypothetical protein
MTWHSPQHVNPWGIYLSAAMRRALVVLSQHGRLERFAGRYGVAPLGEQFQEQTVLALIERHLVEMEKSRRDYRSHYVKLTATGRLCATAILAAEKKETTP